MAAAWPPANAQLVQRLAATVRAEEPLPKPADEEADKAKPPRSPTKSADREGGADDADPRSWTALDELSSNGDFGFLALSGLLAPIWIPKLMVEDPSFSEPGYFNRYPYLHGYPGFMQDDIDDPHGQFGYLLRTRLDYLPEVDQSRRMGGQFLFDTGYRLGFDADVQWLRNWPRTTAADELWFGDANVIYRFAQSPRWIGRIGCGVNWLHDQIGTEEGFNFTYSSDWFPRNPWIVSTEVDWGRLGDSPLFHARGSVGIQYHRVEILAGYDYLALHRVDQQGLVAGLRFWY